MWRNDQTDKEALSGPEIPLSDMVEIAQALSDESRLRVLNACRSGELCVCQIVELLGLAPSTVSKHLAILKRAGLLSSRKDGRWMHYRLADAPEGSPASRALVWALESLDRTALADADRNRLQCIVQMEPEVLCLKQRGNAACCSSAPETPAEARWPKAGRDRSQAT